MKRDDLIRALRRYARKEGLSFAVDTGRGKGSHYTVALGERFTIVQSGELSPLMVQRICKQLGVDPASL